MNIVVIIVNTPCVALIIDTLIRKRIAIYRLPLNTYSNNTDNSDSTMMQYDVIVTVYFSQGQDMWDYRGMECSRPL